MHQNDVREIVSTKILLKLMRIGMIAFLVYILLIKT